MGTGAVTWAVGECCLRGLKSAQGTGRNWQRPWEPGAGWEEMAFEQRFEGRAGGQGHRELHGE